MTPEQQIEELEKKLKRCEDQLEEARDIVLAVVENATPNPIGRCYVFDAEIYNRAFKFVDG